MNVPVRKIEIILPKEKTNETLDKLQEDGFLEIIPEEKTSDSFFKPNNQLDLSEVSFALSFLESFQEKENFIKNLISSFIPSRKRITVKELEEIIQSQEIQQNIKKCALIEEKLNSLENQKQTLSQEIDVLKRFQKTSVFSGLSFKKIKYLAGYLDKQEFLEEIKEKTYHLEKNQDETAFVLFFLKKDESFFKEVLERNQVKLEDVFWQDYPEKALDERERKVKKINLEIEIQRKEAQKIVLTVPRIQALFDWLNWQKDKDDLFNQGEKTRKFFRVKAWLAQEDIVKVEKTIQSITKDYLLEELPVDEEEKPPVIVKNKGLISSFGIVTGVYGLPKTNELDPTPYLAPFFVFYFALALSDSGYGALLVALSLIAKKMFNGVDRFFNLFIVGGLLTIIAGVFSGTVFGSNITESLRIIDPMRDPVGTLIFVLGLGFFQILVGLIIGFIWMIKSNQTKQAISTNGASIVFLIGMALFLITKEKSFVLSGLTAMVLLAVFYSETENIFQKITKGFGSVYGLIGYMSDILSYSRILALGLATGIIAAVINLIAVIFKDMIPIPGVNWLVAGIVLIVGHIGNLLINALGAFIHSARLQFVEFFSKFMEGGGRYLRPFERKSRFIEIIKIN